MTTFIVIPRCDEEGYPLDPDTYPLNTDAEVAEARAAMREAEMESAPVWTGDAEGESVKTWMVLLADLGH